MISKFTTFFFGLLEELCLNYAYRNWLVKIPVDFYLRVFVTQRSLFFVENFISRAGAYQNYQAKQNQKPWVRLNEGDFAHNQFEAVQNADKRKCDQERKDDRIFAKGRFGFLTGLLIHLANFFLQVLNRVGDFLN